MGPKETCPEPRERAYVVCFDDSAKFWEVCCLPSKTGRWFRPDGGTPQFSPSSWVTCSGDASGTKNAEILNVFASAQPILTAPKSGAIIILLDDISRAWEVGYWSSGIFNWTQMDGKPLRISPTHWASATSNCSDITPASRASQVDNTRFDDPLLRQKPAVFLHAPCFPLVETVIAPPSTRRANLGRGLLAISALVGLLTAGHTLGILGDFGELRPSQTEIVTSFSGRGHKNNIEEISSIDNSAVKLEARSLLERERGASIARGLAIVPEEFAGRTAAEASARMEAAQPTGLVEALEKVWTGELDAERERSDGIARDLATVRAELADRNTTEASARMEVAQLASLLEANEKEWTTRLNAERERSDGIVRDLATVRAELSHGITAESSARLEVARLASLLEANEKEWTTRLNEERERSHPIARDLATVRVELSDRIAAESSARMDVGQLARLLEANEKEWTTRLNSERERSDGIARDLATVRAELADRITAETSARTEVAELASLLDANEKEWTTRLSAERERSDEIARDLATVRAELADRITAEDSARIANDLTTNIKTESAITDRLKTVTVRDPLSMPIDRGGSSISTIVVSAVDEAKLIARAQFLIGQGDVGGARRFLERAVEGGSAHAAFLLAETYDWRTLRALQVYGVRGDTKRALELYGAASKGGIDKAKERISALEGAEGP